MKPRLLVVEDDMLLAEAISDYFTNKKWQVTHFVKGDEVLESIRTTSYQLILLDVMLPRQNGFTICRQIREISSIPIFFITARVLEEDELNGYALGADDYITKPFSLPVLYAKAMAVLGRIRGDESFSKISRGNITVNLSTHEIKIDGVLCHLPPFEYKLLLYFLENPNRVFTREQLLIRFWGYDFDGTDRVIDNHIKKLRKMIANSNCVIQTVRKTGYRLEVKKE